MAPVGVFVTDTGGLTTYWNKRLCEITGMRIVDGLGTGWADGVHPDDRERVFKEWYESAEKRASFNCEYRFVDRDGAVTHAIGQASPLIDASSRVNWVRGDHYRHYRSQAGRGSAAGERRKISIPDNKHP